MTDRTVLVVDWPSRDVPESFVRDGYVTYVHGGPEPTDYSVFETRDDAIVERSVDHAPERVDLVYVYRPVDELPGIVAFACGLGASEVRFAGTGNREIAREVVEAAGLRFVEP
jgi:predicted CoA-binding protein